MKTETDQPDQTIQKCLGSVADNDSCPHLLRKLSSLPMSAAEQKPDHAGLSYSSLASTVQRNTNISSSRQSWWRPWARRTRKPYSVLVLNFYSVVISHSASMFAAINLNINFGVGASRLAVHKAGALCYVNASTMWAVASSARRAVAAVELRLVVNRFVHRRRSGLKLNITERLGFVSCYFSNDCLLQSIRSATDWNLSGRILN